MCPRFPRTQPRRRLLYRAFFSTQEWGLTPLPTFLPLCPATKSVSCHITWQLLAYVSVSPWPCSLAPCSEPSTYLTIMSTRNISLERVTTSSGIAEGINSYFSIPGISFQTRQPAGDSLVLGFGGGRSCLNSCSHPAGNWETIQQKPCLPSSSENCLAPLKL